MQTRWVTVVSEQRKDEMMQEPHRALVGCDGLDSARVDDAQEEHGEVEGAQDVGHVLDALPAPRQTRSQHHISVRKSQEAAHTIGVPTEHLKDYFLLISTAAMSRKSKGTGWDGIMKGRGALFVVDIEQDETEKDRQHPGKDKAGAVVGHVAQIALPEPAASTHQHSLTHSLAR